MSAATQPHPCDRFKERYGWYLTEAGLREIEARLAAGEGMLLSQKPDGTQIRVLRVGPVLATVVFAAHRGAVKTFLPPNAGTVAGRRKYQFESSRRRA